MEFITHIRNSSPYFIHRPKASFKRYI